MSTQARDHDETGAGPGATAVAGAGAAAGAADHAGAAQTPGGDRLFSLILQKIF